MIMMILNIIKGLDLSARSTFKGKQYEFMILHISLTSIRVYLYIPEHKGVLSSIYKEQSTLVPFPVRYCTTKIRLELLIYQYCIRDIFTCSQQSW
jgi:hypothetical protein